MSGDAVSKPANEMNIISVRLGYGFKIEQLSENWNLIFKCTVIMESLQNLVNSNSRYQQAVIGQVFPSV